MKIKKKGVSEIIATVVILFVTVATVSILSVFIIPFVKNKLNSSTECISYKNYFTFDESFNYNCNSRNLYAFSIKAQTTTQNISSNIKGFDLILKAEGSSKKISIINNADSSCSENGIKILGKSCPSLLKVPAEGETQTFVYNKSSAEKDFTLVEVYPYLNSGKSCEKSDEIKITLCKDVSIS